MKDFKENKIIINRVKELFQQLLLILETEGDDEVNYAKKELAQNIEALEGVLSNNVDAAEAQEVLGQIKTSYKSMYPPRGGLWNIEPARVEMKLYRLLQASPIQGG